MEKTNSIKRFESEPITEEQVARALDLLTHPDVRKTLYSALQDKYVREAPLSANDHYDWSPVLNVRKLRSRKRAGGKVYTSDWYMVTVPRDIAEALDLRDGSPVILRKYMKNREIASDSQAKT
jgi:hypothetical protein